MNTLEKLQLIQREYSGLGNVSVTIGGYYSHRRVSTIHIYFWFDGDIRGDGIIWNDALNDIHQIDMMIKHKVWKR